MIEAKVRRSYYYRLAFVGTMSFGIGFLLMGLEHRQWVKFLDNQGITRRDGKQMQWNNLKSMRFVRWRNRSARLNHIELIFGNGRAKVFPEMIENVNEVMRFLKNYPGGGEAAKYGF